MIRVEQKQIGRINEMKVVDKVDPSFALQGGVTFKYRTLYCIR